MSKKSHQKHEAAKHHKQHSRTQTIKPIPEEDIFTEHKFGSEVIIALIIFALGIFFMVPLYSASTVAFQFVALTLFMLAVLAFMITHWRKLKKQKDHPQMPLMERFVFLGTISILSVAIVVQVLSGTLDLWLPAILIVIILLKVLLTSHDWKK